MSEIESKAIPYGELQELLISQQKKLIELESKLAKAVKAVKACAHIGVDCGYGEYTAEWAINIARKTLKEIGEQE